MYVNILYCNMYIYNICMSCMLIFYIVICIYIYNIFKKKHVITIVWAIVQIFHSYPAAWVTDGF
jgi:hypothetical protein